MQISHAAAAANLGDVPTWIAAGAAILAVVLSWVAFKRQADQTKQLQTSQDMTDRLALYDAKKLVKDVQTGWQLEPPGRIIAFIRNGSAEVVMQPLVTIKVDGGPPLLLTFQPTILNTSSAQWIDTASATDEIPVVLPPSHGLSATATFPDGSPTLTSQSDFDAIDVTIQFTDEVGASWEVSKDNVRTLSKAGEPPRRSRWSRWRMGNRPRQR